MTRTVSVDSDDTVLSELLEQLAAGDVVQLTKDGRIAAVVLDRDTYDELILAAGQDARRELAEAAAQTRRRVAEAGLDQNLVDEAIAAVRAEQR